MTNHEDESNKVARQFLELWQKQLSGMFTDPNMVNMSLKMMQDFQKTVMSSAAQKGSENQYRNAQKRDEKTGEATQSAAASSITTELLLAQFASSLQGIERRLSEIESRIEQLDAKSAKPAATKRPRKNNRSNTRGKSGSA